MANSSPPRPISNEKASATPSFSSEFNSSNTAPVGKRSRFFSRNKSAPILDNEKTTTNPSKVEPEDLPPVSLRALFRSVQSIM